MVIDTTSCKGIENSLANLMGISVPKLYQYIEAAAVQPWKVNVVLIRNFLIKLWKLFILI